VEAAAKLIEHWRRQGLPIAKGCHPESLDEFESRNHVILPKSMRDYFRVANGMRDTHSQDRRGFSFWPLSQVIPVEEEVERHTPFLRHFPGDDEFFVFADYLDWSWGYAIRLKPGTSDRVVLFGKESPELVAESFEEFVGLYVEDGRALYEGDAIDVP